MRQSTYILMTALVVQVYSAPQLISFKDGRIGVNFAGYHASAGLGGAAGKGGAGGLFAEAGTPFGQRAGAGLGGAVDNNGQSSAVAPPSLPLQRMHMQQQESGGLYAGATAGGNVRAQAGLAGGVTNENSAGSGYASAQAGNRFAAAGMGGEANGEGAGGFSFSGSKSFGVSGVKVKEVAVQPLETVEVPQPVIKEIHTDVKLEADNEINPIPAEHPVTVTKEVSTMWGRRKHYKSYYRSNFKDDIYNSLSYLFRTPAYYQQELSWQSPRYEVYRVVPKVFVPPPPPPTKVIEKTYVHTHYKPHRHHFHKYVGGYIGGEAAVQAPPAPPALEVQPVIHKRIDVASETAVGGEQEPIHPGGHIGYRKQVTYQRNPDFYKDIFNIPISALKSVSDLVSGIVGGTSVSVQKSASVHTDAEAGSSKHHIAPLSSSSETQVSVQTPPASNFFENIFAIPINTLGAVNKFLENNAARKTVQITQGSEEHSAPIRVRRGKHARRRANKQVIIETVDASHDDQPSLPEAQQ